MAAGGGLRRRLRETSAAGKTAAMTMNAPGAGNTGRSYPTRKHTAVMRERLSLAGLKVADIGCGSGALARFMAREGAATFGIEIGLTALARALGHQESARPDSDQSEKSPDGPRYLCARGETLPLGDATLDCAVYFNSLHHVPVPDQPAALAEATRVLVPGGLLYIVEPLAEGPGHALVKPIDDETEVRARAYEAIAAAAGNGSLEALAEDFYEAPERVASFQAFKQHIVDVDPARRPLVEAQGPDWEQQFLACAEPLPEDQGGGFRMTWPTRLNLLRRR